MRQGLQMIGAAVLALAMSVSVATATGWTGCHVGVMGGVAAMNVELGLGPASIDGLGGDGWRGGVGGGCDVQLDRLVVGAFGDYH